MSKLRHRNPATSAIGRNATITVTDRSRRSIESRWMRDLGQVTGRGYRNRGDHRQVKARPSTQSVAARDRPQHRFELRPPEPSIRG